jgi:Flp pilus assembly protein TadD
MDVDREVERWIGLGASAIDRGHAAGAIDPLRRALTLDPDHARAHALLGLALLRMKRVGSALYEANAAVALAPEASHAHEILGHVLLADRKLDQAREHFRAARDLDPGSVGVLRGLAAIARVEDHHDEAIALLDEALALDPVDVDTLVALGQTRLDRGRLDDAEARAREALGISPEDVDALVLMGRVLLRRGDTAGAREHAVWALRNGSGEGSGALELLVSVKARESLLLGAWFRANAALSDFGPKAMVILLAAYVAQRLLTLALEDLGHAELSRLVSFAWLGICLYSWVAPGVFRKMLARELATVRLDPSF